jgi:ABC-type Mn2+/Zn2+ transport system ATPase subunit
MGEYKGAEWVKVDLHLHSPGVDSFKLPSGINIHTEEDREKLIKAYVEKLKKAEIKIAAITDYNGIRKEWFTQIKEEAEKEGTILFPGVELDIIFAGGKYGLHILIIFDKDENIEGINTFIHSLDKNPQNSLFNNRNHRSLESRYEFEELVKEIREKFNCLIIFCHPEDDKGFLKSFNPQQCAKYLNSIKPDAIEFYSDDWRNILQSTDEINLDTLKKIAVIENSDPKSLDKIGNKMRNDKIRATYLKLSDFTLDAIKLALHDPSVRVRLYEKPEMIFDRISYVKINGTKFLSDISLPLNPELNTFIGGRGVGKSAILESIRYCLNLPIYSEAGARKEFVNEVVGSGGEIEVEIVRFHGEKPFEYKIRRIIGKEVEVIESETGRKLSFDINQLFNGKPPIIIGQKELYYVASDKKFQLALVDDLIGENVKKKQRELEEIIKKLEENGEEIIKLKEKLKKKEEYEQELKNIEDELEIFEKLKVIDKLKKWTNILENERKLLTAGEKLEDVIDQIENVLTDNLDVLKGQMEYLQKSEPQGQEIINEAISVLSEFEKFLGSFRDEFLDKAKDVSSRYKKIQDEWSEFKNDVEKEVNQIKKELGKEKLKPERLEELINRKTLLQSILMDLHRYEEELKKKIEERESIKSEIKEKRHELFKVRQEEIEKINGFLKGRARLRIEFEKETAEFKEKLKNLLTGSGIRAEVIENIIKMEDLVIDGILLSEYIDKGEDKLKEVFKFTDAMAKRFIEHFKEDSIRFKLETLYPEDRVTIELRVNSEFKPIEDLSVGQKATALLLLLFVHESRILILDQPEEDLDNRFIYEDVVKILRELKGKRQVIVATHNANIPVIGDAELIYVLEAERDKCKIIDKGSVDKVSIKQHIKHIMEGGEEAFRLRIEKYGGI